MQHHQGLSYTWLSMPLLMPLWLGVSPTAELSLIGAESPVMAEKLTERSIKWQLCYDISARTWWMVSALFALCPVLSRPCSSLRLSVSAFKSGFVEESDIVRKAFPIKDFGCRANCLVKFLSQPSFWSIFKSILGIDVRFLQACSFNSDHCKLSYASV